MLIGASTFDRSDQLPNLPAVHNNLVDLWTVLTDPSTGIFAKNRCRVVEEPSTPPDAVRPLDLLARQAEDLLLVYYAGHGVQHPLRDELYLAVGSTDETILSASAVAFETIRDAVENSPARTKLLILDCCYSGMAVGAMSAATLRPSEVRIEGTSVIASSPRNKFSFAPPGDRYTAFSAELIRLLKDGPSIGGLPLTVQTLFGGLLAAMANRNMPSPQMSSRNTSGELLLRRPPPPNIDVHLPRRPIPKPTPKSIAPKQPSAKPITPQKPPAKPIGTPAPTVESIGTSKSAVEPIGTPKPAAKPNVTPASAVELIGRSTSVAEPIEAPTSVAEPIGRPQPAAKAIDTLKLISKPIEAPTPIPKPATTSTPILEATPISKPDVIAKPVSGPASMSAAAPGPVAAPVERRGGSLADQPTVPAMRPVTRKPAVVAPTVSRIGLFLLWVSFLFFADFALGGLIGFAFGRLPDGARSSGDLGVGIGTLVVAVGLGAIVVWRTARRRALGHAARVAALPKMPSWLSLTLLILVLVFCLCMIITAIALWNQNSAPVDQSSASSLSTMAVQVMGLLWFVEAGFVSGRAVIRRFTAARPDQRGR